MDYRFVKYMTYFYHNDDKCIDFYHNDGDHAGLVYYYSTIAVCITVFVKKMA